MKEIIEKAVKGGFDFAQALSFNSILNIYENQPEHRKSLIDSFVLSHDFLRSYFGQEETCMRCGQWFMKACTKDTSHKEIGVAWQYHSQQLVLSEDRIEYLRRFLND